MYFKQFYLGCLAHASYLIGSDGEAVVVDPQRDIEQYLTEAARHGLKIKYVVETHLHADFVSGHHEMAERTNAEIVFGKNVGRPDLVGSKGFTAEQMAGMLYDSLHNMLLTLADGVEVYPAHGAGSLCGRNPSKETSSTIGEQKRFNYALKPMPKDEFVKMMTTDLPEVPPYFTRDAEINLIGAPALAEVGRPVELQPAEVNKLTQQGYLILDVRDGADFGNGHIPGALNVGLGGQFASWAGTLVAMGTPIIITADEIVKVDEAVMRLARVGIESVKGYLSGGMYGWDKASLETTRIAQMPVDELRQQIAERRDLQIIDVRRPAEYRTGHVSSAVNAQLADLEKKVSQFNPLRATAVICRSGYRSSIATSLLERHGFRNLFNIIGGTSAWESAGFPLVEQTCVTAD